MGRNGKGKKRKRESRREEVMGRKGERKGGSVASWLLGDGRPCTHTRSERGKQIDRQTDGAKDNTPFAQHGWHACR